MGKFAENYWSLAKFRDIFAGGSIGTEATIKKACDKDNQLPFEKADKTYLIDVEAFRRKYGDPRDFVYVPQKDIGHRFPEIMKSWDKTIRIGKKWFADRETANKIRQRLLGPEGTPIDEKPSKSNMQETIEQLQKKLENQDELLSAVFLRLRKLEESVDGIKNPISSLPGLKTNKENPGMFNN